MKKSLLMLILAVAVACGAKKNSRELMNVSYDPTREFYRDFNAAFSQYWKLSHPKETISFRMSHGGSGKQARSVIDGLAADVVTLALASDIDAVAAQAKILPADWQKKLPRTVRPIPRRLCFSYAKEILKASKTGTTW